MDIKEILTKQLNPITGWVLFGVIIIGFMTIFFLSADATIKTQVAAEKVPALPKNTGFIPRTIVRDNITWRRINTDLLQLKETKVLFRVPYGYKNNIAYYYDSVDDSYTFASIKSIMDDDCRVLFYRNIRGSAPGLKVKRMNGDQMTIRVADKNVLLADYFKSAKQPEKNYAYLPDELSTMRRIYHVGEYYFYNLAELPSAKQDQTSQQQRDLFCKDAKILEADEIFNTSLESLEPIR